jgi:hypothetical protein
MRKEYWFALWTLIVIVTIAFLAPTNRADWSMVYEAVQTPEAPGGQKRFVLFNEDHLSRQECTDLFNEHLRRLNNNAAVIEYEISCKHLKTKGHGYLFQRQMYWLIG